MRRFALLVLLVPATGTFLSACGATTSGHRVASLEPVAMPVVEEESLTTP